MITNISLTITQRPSFSLVLRKTTIENEPYIIYIEIISLKKILEHTLKILNNKHFTKYVN